MLVSRLLAATMIAGPVSPRPAPSISHTAIDQAERASEAAAGSKILRNVGKELRRSRRGVRRSPAHR